MNLEVRRQMRNRDTLLRMKINKINCWLKPNKNKRLCQKILVLKEYGGVERREKSQHMTCSA